MGRITFIEHSGTAHVVEIEAGQSLMQVAVDNGIPGIDADCGGACACGTCHVIVDEQWIDATGGINADEQGMLGLTPEITGTSRLSCQVTLSDALDGLIVRLPEFQM
ncbi:MAG: ferredoxin, 2Fe-2S [Marinobacter excellens HL-55]|uniref:Ferredoxin, 2Fe-2S n=1 Tax=Marinobacter excellens HL-55 TaxID=1305731 RepID=A0A0P7Y913_9GAMM|nr:MAG: ferredoxin, 2Fe-2S [Marinobacter excellens HL-55]